MRCKEPATSASFSARSAKLNFSDMVVNVTLVRHANHHSFASMTVSTRVVTRGSAGSGDP